MKPENPVLVIGAGIGGMACAIALAARGIAVEIVERSDRAGGKMREIRTAGTALDVGPTVFTMRWVFDELFAEANSTLDDALTLQPLAILARHAWNAVERLDLHADSRASADAIGHFADAEESRRFLAFCDEARAIYRTLERPFLSASRPGPLSLTARIGFHRIGALLGIRPFETLWSRLASHFRDPRLRQLFGRYATYCGSSPFSAPATLMLIAHVEQDGVWLVEGGMQRLAEALEGLARRLGVVFHFGREVREILLERGRVSGIRLSAGEPMDCRAVVVNADAAAVADGLFGASVSRAATFVPPERRSLSAVTWGLVAQTTGFPLLRHNVFFSGDYAAEFESLKHRLSDDPTIYVCAQDRGGADEEAPRRPERLMMLVNAPANGDGQGVTEKEIAACERRLSDRLSLCGLEIGTPSEPAVITSPADFHRLFPGTGGALYGQATHGWRASFQRPGSATAIPGLYLAGGSTHPGAGVPMAALSGRLAALRLMADLFSTRRFHPAAISGGISTA
jgi:1-hydroxycarotenoid 3,4-desaturase